MPARIFIKVDLPAPFSPIRAWISPDLRSKWTSVSAATPPKCLLMPDATSTAPTGDWEAVETAIPLTTTMASLHVADGQKASLNVSKLSICICAALRPRIDTEKDHRTRSRCAHPANHLVTVTNRSKRFARMDKAVRNAKKSGAPTMIDVARAAGVSIATVSAFINGTTNVSTELTLRIEKAIRDIG